MPIQTAELLYKSSPSYDVAAIADRAEALIQSDIEVPQSEATGNAILLRHRKIQIQLKDAVISPQTAILSSDKSPVVDDYTEKIQQSWSCNNAAQRIEASTCSRLVTEMMARAITPAERVRLFHGVLQACVEITEPHAIVLGHSQQIVAPDDYLASCSDDPINRLGALNVRFFSVSNSQSGDMLMDTRGLDEIGLSDLQCHFRDLDPNDVSQVLLNTALYLFDAGPVIESGQTVAGTEPDSKWQCQFEDSLIEPKREVLAINPGQPFAAGGR